MAQIVNHAQDIRIKSAITTASAKEPALEKETVTVFVTKVIMETLVQNALLDIMNLTKMKRLCYVLHATQHVTDLAKGLDQKIAKNVQMDGT